MMTRSRPAGRWRWLGATALALVLAACQTPPEPRPAGLSPQQQQVLRSQGFAPGDDGWELQMSGKLLFSFDSADVSAEARTKVQALARALKGVGIERLRVEGHTDARGSDAYNLRLSLRRAEAVADVLAEGGLARSAIEVKGLGSALPVVPSDAAENRRVAIVVPLQ
jgi:outer membrane protein OmpA-like peptidoglycan-associated protein